jgi:hypothetical protein
MDSGERMEVKSLGGKKVPCPYCGALAALVHGDVVYPHRTDLKEKRFYICPPCKAWVGCHPGGTKPLGRLANAELRRWKMEAHAHFDPLWMRRVMSRTKAYKWLALELGLTVEETHIGMFDVAMCKKVVEACRLREFSVSGPVV